MAMGTRRWTAIAALSAPLTILGVERRWFILSLTAAAVMLNLFKAFFGPALLFGLLYTLGLLAHYRDPEMLRIVANSSRFRARYDPGKAALRPRTVQVAV